MSKPPDKIAGYLQVGIDAGEVVVIHPDIDADKDGVGHLVFSPAQARRFAKTLLLKADLAEAHGEQGWSEAEAETAERGKRKERA